MNSKPSTLRFLAFAVTAALVLDPLAFAQQPPPPGGAPQAAAKSSAPAGSQQELDELLAPIALYPDALLAQVFMASTYPLEVVEAARWQKANATLKDKALEEAVAKQTWDESVKALTAVPQVLTMMNEKLDWTTKLGDVFLAKQEEVLKTVQTLRVKAEQAGNLKSSPELTVKKETQEGKQVVIIEQPKPEVVYVPTYNPATVYGTWWYSYPPPYYYYPPGYAYAGAGLAFASGVFWGAAIAGGIGWGNNDININRNTNINTGDRNNINGGNRNNVKGGDKWQHNPEHRKGAAYKDSGTAQKYNRGSQNSASRDQFRGKAEQGRSDLSSMDRGQLNSQVDRASAQSRGSGDRGGGSYGGGDRGGGSYGGGDRGGGSRGGASAGTTSRGSSSGFSGSGGGGASTRAASSRGSTSRGGGGGGGRGGGGRR